MGWISEPKSGERKKQIGTLEVEVENADGITLGDIFQEACLPEVLPKEGIEADEMVRIWLDVLLVGFACPSAREWRALNAVEEVE